MDIKDLRSLVKQGESYRLEFKESLADQDSILKELCAFANTAGGTVLVGVTDRGEIRGLKLAPKTEAQLVNRILDSIQSPLAPEVELVPVGKGKVVMRLSVPGHPKAAHAVKGKPYIRVGSVSKPMPREEFERRIREHQPITWETTLVEGATEDDIDFRAVRAYIGRYNSARGEKLKLPPREVLLARNCAVDVEGKLRPTRAGILLFGKRPEKFFHKTYISVARFAGRQITDTILDSKDYYGRLMDIIDRAEQYVKGHYDIMQKLVEGQAATQPIHQYPPWAVRELIVNAVCHRDYGDYGSRIMVFMLRDRIEFHSPGGFPAGITARNVLGKQFTRNPVIARVLHDAGYIEQFGSGLDRVFGEAREHPLKPKLPTIAADAGQVVVTLHSPEEFLAAPPGEAVPVPLSSRQEKILAYVREHREINSLLCEKELGIPQRTAHRELQEMVGKGVLVALGERRGRRYRLANNG